ncbi:ion transporter [Pediococcus damnosus]|uniref:potassium channel family protein n=1 Tax=Pediococcus damnosus TaxID=51663 RepID=UPI001142A647|nr:potassium channel family protein [Pediococcus damnosus]GEA93354.1 ion transporter [Pediococcus damnosus]
MKSKLNIFFNAPLYNVVIAILALISIVFSILDFGNVISLLKLPYIFIDNGIILIFAFDYFGRFWISKNKGNFFVHNIFDLLSIIPFNSVASFLRVARLVRIARLLKIIRFIRVIGVTGKFSKNVKRFLETNGFIYMVYASVTILFIASTLYSLAENVSLPNSIWWAITTTTTVGYGDISPKTFVGKLAAVLLMFVGIGLIGMLTSTITNFFIHDKNNDEDKINVVYQQNKELMKEVKELKEEIKKINK